MMKTNHVLLLALALVLVTTSPGSMAARVNVNLNCATTSAVMEMEGPCSTSSCADFCAAKFQGSGTCFPQGCKCSFCRDIPPATKN
ncbi:hypothetical protein EJB05_20290 [Eragrostis curvula]|uniref:Knottin scorpion toxin-like domain-containing protein n=1 Tax=Eragrostis curvula TaxID=38414 RepID=A0A5J9UZX4_9POAL|nr:hypothetical protein EJB05_20290 [Eragrostis curvula]